MGHYKIDYIFLIFYLKIHFPHNLDILDVNVQLNSMNQKPPLFYKNEANFLVWDRLFDVKFVIDFEASLEVVSIFGYQ